MIKANSDARGAKVLGAALALTLGLGAVAGCSSKSDDASSKKDAKTTSSVTASENKGTDDDNSDDSQEGLPKGWPDVPMPEFTEVLSSSEPSEDSMQVMLQTDSTMSTTVEEAIAAYAETLTKAGWTVEAEDESLEASNDKHEISSYSASAGTLIVVVSEK